MADFGQTDCGQTDFGQLFDQLWPIVGLNRLWPNRVSLCVDRLWPNRLWPILEFLCVGQIF